MAVRKGLDLAIAGIAVASAATVSRASYTYTFDNSSSFTAIESGFNYNPTVPNFRLDGGTPAGNATHSATATTVAGNGAVQITLGYNFSSEGAGGNSYTIDLFTGGAEPTNVSNISFDVRVDPSSAKDAYGGAGYFEVVTRNDNYDYNKISTFNTELGDPTYANPSPTVGTYEHFSIPVSGVYSTVRALTLSLYNGSDRHINGNVIYDLDNLVLTTPGSTPEPASLGLMALAAPMLMKRRRA